MELGYTREIHLKSLRRANASFFKITNKGKSHRMFSLAFNFTKSDVEFLPNEISSKKVCANNVDFSTIEIISKKVRRKNVDISISEDFSTSEITPEKVRGNNLDFLTIEIMSKKNRGNNVDLSIITSKKYVEITLKFVEIWFRRIDVISTLNRRRFDVCARWEVDPCA